MTYKALPVEGLILCSDLADFFGLRNDKLKDKLSKKGVKTINLSTHAKYRLVNIADLKQLK